MKHLTEKEIRRAIRIAIKAKQIESNPIIELEESFGVVIKEDKTDDHSKFYDRLKKDLYIKQAKIEQIKKYGGHYHGGHYHKTDSPFEYSKPKLRPIEETMHEAMHTLMGDTHSMTDDAIIDALAPGLADALVEMAKRMK